ncbi:MAG: FliO/MopB family protein [Phycisphaerales bacterium]
MPRLRLRPRRALLCTGCFLVTLAGSTWAAPPAANRPVRISPPSGNANAGRPADDLSIPPAIPSATGPTGASPNDPDARGGPLVRAADASDETRGNPVDRDAARSPRDRVDGPPIADAHEDSAASSVAPGAAAALTSDTPASAGSAASAAADATGTDTDTDTDTDAAAAQDRASLRARRAAFGGRRIGSGGGEPPAPGAAANRGTGEAMGVAASDDASARGDRGGGGISRWGMSGGGWELARVGLALGVVLAIALGLQRLVRRVSPGSVGRPSGVLEIMARYPVGRGQQLIVIRLARRLLLVHQHSGTMRPLTEITDPEEVAGMLATLDPKGAGSDFDAMVRSYQTGDGRDFPEPETAPARRPERPVAAEMGVGRLLDQTVGLDDEHDDRGVVDAPPSASRLQSALGALRAARRSDAGARGRAGQSTNPRPDSVEIVDLTTRDRRPRRQDRSGAIR